MQINGEIVRSIRNARNWTQEELANAAKLDKGTVSRVERGAYPDLRGSTGTKLARALGVNLRILTGEEELSRTSKSELFDTRVRLELDIDDGADNALFFAAKRYRVTKAQIVELAPFLFSWAAEMSLRRRAQALDLVVERQATLQAMQQSIAHVSSSLGYSQFTDEIIEEERRSIIERDLFAESMTERDYGNILKHDFEPSEDGPIVVYLRSLADEVPEALHFRSWGPRSAPDFEVAREEIDAAFGGDEDAVHAVLTGQARMVDMPTALRAKDRLEQRIDWARREGAAFQGRLNEEWAKLGIDLDALLAKPSGGGAP